MGILSTPTFASHLGITKPRDTTLGKVVSHIGRDAKVKTSKLVAAIGKTNFGQEVQLAGHMTAHVVKHSHLGKGIVQAAIHHPSLLAAGVAAGAIGTGLTIKGVHTQLTKLDTHLKAKRANRMMLVK